MGYLHAVILGVVEGITEFLPISSTGHLVLAGRLLGLESGDFLKTFEIAIQSGAIAAAMLLHGFRLFKDRRLALRVAAAFIPTAIAGLIAYPLVKSLLGNPAIVLWAMGIGGVLLIAFERWYEEPADASEDVSLLPYRSAILIGVAQCFAFIPGVSRAATTVVTGLALGLSRRAIVEFSFLLAIPTLAAATVLDMYKNADLLAGANLGLLGAGFCAAFVVALITMQWLLRFIRTHDFTSFGIYRIVVAALLWFVLF